MARSGLGVPGVSAACETWINDWSSKISMLPTGEQTPYNRQSRMTPTFEDVSTRRVDVGLCPSKPVELGLYVS
jgi:hypothetical protein